MAASWRALLSLRAILSFFVVLLATIQVLVIALSLGSIRLTQVGAIVILVIASLLAFLASQTAGQGPPNVTSAEDLSLFSPLLRRFLLLAPLTIFGAFALLACLTPDLSYDGNAYHIPPINQWAVKGFIHDVDPSFDQSEFMNGYPKGAEAVTFVVVQAFGSKFLNLLNLFYAPLGFFGVAVLCQLFGASIRDSLVFGAAYLIVPVNAGQYGSTYVDAAFGSTVIALLAIFASDVLNEPDGWRTSALPMGCAIGNVIAVKGSGLVVDRTSKRRQLFGVGNERSKRPSEATSVAALVDQPFITFRHCDRRVLVSQEL